MGKIARGEQSLRRISKKQICRFTCDLLSTLPPLHMLILLSVAARQDQLDGYLCSIWVTHSLQTILNHQQSSLQVLPPQQKTSFITRGVNAEMMLHSPMIAVLRQP